MLSNSVIFTSPLKMMVPIIKVVGNYCNLRCGYCFYNEREQSMRTLMSEQLLDKFMSEYFNLFSGRVNFIWHGGEPLLAGIPFFERAMTLQKRYAKGNHVIRNSIQTNATLVDEEWAKFFKINNFKVGVSIDGREKSHNEFRKNKIGEGSFEHVVRGIRILQKNNVRLGFIQTLTHNTVANLSDDFEYFVKELGVRSWGINHYFAQNSGLDTIGQQIDNKQLTEYLTRCIDLWLVQNDPKLRLREIDHFIAGAIGKNINSCSFNGTCTSYFCLSYDGKIYPCDRFSEQDQYLFGDLSRHSLIEILNGNKRLQYAKDVNDIHGDCANCKWFKGCNNGCVHHRIGNIKGKYYFCETRQHMFAHLNNIIEDFRSRRSDVIN